MLLPAFSFPGKFNPAEDSIGLTRWIARRLQLMAGIARCTRNICSPAPKRVELSGQSKSCDLRVAEK
eukprot:4118392-Heterocapsa_arctica.AAC.1